MAAFRAAFFAQWRTQPRKSNTGLQIIKCAFL